MSLTAADPDNAALLEVSDLRIAYTSTSGVVDVVRDVSFRVKRGETVALVGESGSGKSTIGLAIMGLLPPAGSVTAGTVRFEDQDLVGLSEDRWRRLRGAEISMVFQDPLSALNPVLTVGRQIAEVFTAHQQMSAAEAREKTLELLRRVRMPDPEQRFKQYPQQFSGGMRQRVVIAMALALNPRLIVADEPTTALDVTVQERIMDLLDELISDQESGLLLITHDLAVVADKADRIYVLYAGQVMESGPIRAVYDAPANPYTLGLLSSVPVPDQVGRALDPIPGSPPDPATLGPGCPFAPRCDVAADRCIRENPPLVEIAPGRFSACHFAKEVATDGRTVAARP
ncbi:MAG: ABC transporter ATP-binding protein [Propioniciclava sp.]